MGRKKCKEEVSTTSIIDMALHSWREIALSSMVMDDLCGFDFFVLPHVVLLAQKKR